MDADSEEDEDEEDEDDDMGDEKKKKKNGKFHPKAQLSQAEIDKAFQIIMGILTDHMTKARELTLLNLDELEDNFSKIPGLWEELKQAYYQTLPKLHELETLRYREKKDDDLLTTYETRIEQIHNEMKIRFSNLDNEDYDTWIENPPEQINKNRNPEKEKKTKKKNDTKSTSSSSEIEQKGDQDNSLDEDDENENIDPELDEAAEAAALMKEITKNKSTADAFSTSIDVTGNSFKDIFTANASNVLSLSILKYGKEHLLLEEDRRDQLNEIMSGMSSEYREEMRNRLMKIDPIRTAKLIPLSEAPKYTQPFTILSSSSDIYTPGVIRKKTTSAQRQHLE